MKSVVRFLATSLCMSVLLVFVPVQAQQSKSSPTPGISIAPTPGGQFYALNAYMNILTKRMDELRMREFNADRQKHLVLDAKKLVDLATDLDRNMKGMGDTELSPMDLSKKAAEIERLAHSVQERMRG